MTYTLDYSQLLSDAVLNCKIHFGLTDEKIATDKEWAKEIVESLDFRQMLLKEIAEIEFDHPLKEDMEDDIFLQLELLEFYLNDFDRVFENAEKEMTIVSAVVKNELRNIEYLSWKVNCFNIVYSIRNLKRFIGIPLVLLALFFPVLTLIVSYFQR